VFSFFVKKISYIIVARNDSYCGDSVGRLQTVLNHTGDILKKHHVLEKSEVVITDWASPLENGPLRFALNLNDNIKSILKIVEVPVDIASKHQKDSPFSEVHAMNTGFRKSTGEFFARIDQDTLIGERFIKWFYNEFNEKKYNFEWPKVAFSGRRNLDEEQSNEYKEWVFNELKSKEVEICHPNNFYSKVSANNRSMFLFYGGAVGIMIIERSLYIKEKGFNEEFIYMNNMDTEFMNRLKHKTSFYNLGLKVDADFYHLNHTRSDGALHDASQPHADTSGTRRTNPLLIRSQHIENTNPEDWGLNSEDLMVYTFK